MLWKAEDPDARPTDNGTGEDPPVDGDPLPQEPEIMEDPPGAALGAAVDPAEDPNSRPAGTAPEGASAGETAPANGSATDEASAAVPVDPASAVAEEERSAEASQPLQGDVSFGTLPAAEMARYRELAFDGIVDARITPPPDAEKAPAAPAEWGPQGSSDNGRNAVL